MGRHNERYESHDDDHDDGHDRYESRNDRNDDGHDRYESRNDDRYEVGHSRYDNDDSYEGYEYGYVSVPTTATPYYSSFPNEIQQEKYYFSFQNNQVTGVYELENGMYRLDAISANESYVFNGIDVFKYEYSERGLETTRYTDVNHNGVYTNVEHTVSQNSTVANFPVVPDIDLVGQHTEAYETHWSHGG